MPFRVTIENSGETFRCSEGINVLAAMEAAMCTGIPVGCRNGGCGACKIEVTAGQYSKRKMNRAVISAEEEARGYVLACKSFPQSDLRVRAIGDKAGTVASRGGASFSFEFTTTSQHIQLDEER
jgi:ferredoxin